MPSMQYILFSLPRQLQLCCYNFSSCYVMDQSLYSSCHKSDRCTIPISSAPAKITFPTLKFNHAVCSLCFPTALLLKIKLLVFTSRLIMTCLLPTYNHLLSIEELAFTSINTQSWSSLSTHSIYKHFSYSEGTSCGALQNSFFWLLASIHKALPFHVAS